MCCSEVEQQAKFDPNKWPKLLVAMALSRSKLIHKWKRKAKQRKQEILSLKEDLKQAKDGSQHDLFPQIRLKERRRRRTGGSTRLQCLYTPGTKF
ncbi:hypothetical protein LguiA_011096 [Lonicera macranthoides]